MKPPGKAEVGQAMERFIRHGLIEGFVRDTNDVVATGMTATGYEVLALKGWRLRWWSFWWDRQHVWTAKRVLGL